MFDGRLFAERDESTVVTESVTLLDTQDVRACADEEARWAYFRDMARQMYPSAAVRRAAPAIRGTLRGSFMAKEIGRDVRLEAIWRIAS